MTTIGRFRKILLYGISRSTADGLLAFRGVLLASLLGPEAFGGWVLFRLATHWAGFARLGIASGLEFHVARGRPADDRGPGRSHWNTALGFVLSVFGVLSLVTLVLSFAVEDTSLAVGMRWFAGAILTEQIWLVGLSYLRARGDLRGYAVYELLNAGLQVAFAALLTPVWGVSGAFASFVAANGVGVVLLVRSLPVSPGLSHGRLREMLEVGLPIVASVLLGFALASADRLIVAAQGDLSLLGLYGFAFSIATMAGSVSWAVRVVVFPEVYAGVASHGEGPALREHLERTVLPFARLLPPLFGVLALMIGPVVSLVLPEYEKAVPAASLLIFLGVTAGFERLGALGVVAAERQRILPLFSVGALALNVTLSALALHAGLGLQGVAAAALFSNAVFGLAAVGLVARVAHDSHPVRLVAGSAFSLLWCVLSVVVIGMARPGLGLRSAVTSLGLYGIALLPLIPGVIAELQGGRWRASAPVQNGVAAARARARPVPVATVQLLPASGPILLKVGRKLPWAGPRVKAVEPSPHHRPEVELVDFRPVQGTSSLPRYLDLNVGDVLRVVRTERGTLEIRVARIEIEKSARASPRTRVILEAGGREFVARCGMRQRRRGGIAPTEVDGVRVGVEVTRLLFSEMAGGRSPFNTYGNLRLSKELRLAVWDGSLGIMPGAGGRFVVSQPVWSRERFGNWLHATRYGIHSAIDVFATPGAPPETVICPVDATVYRVYHRDASADDRRRSKAVNLYGDAIVGPRGERVLYRFHHFSEILVSEGDHVRCGQLLGRTGHTGFDPRIGDHLHFEIRLNPSHFGFPWDENIFATIPVNPYPFLLEWFDGAQLDRR